MKIKHSIFYGGLRLACFAFVSSEVGTFQGRWMDKETESERTALSGVWEHRAACFSWGPCGTKKQSDWWQTCCLHWKRSHLRQVRFLNVSVYCIYKNSLSNCVNSRETRAQIRISFLILYTSEKYITLELFKRRDISETVERNGHDARWHGRRCHGARRRLWCFEAQFTAKIDRLDPVDGKHAGKWSHQTWRYYHNEGRNHCQSTEGFEKLKILSC